MPWKGDRKSAIKRPAVKVKKQWGPVKNQRLRLRK